MVSLENILKCISQSFGYKKQNLINVFLEYIFLKV
jgi:hypothetical protein